MRLFIDECVPEATAEAFESRGHKLYFAREVCPAEPDRIVSYNADLYDSLVVTWNIKDFRKRADDPAPREDQGLNRLGFIGFKCPEPLGAQRVEQLGELIEAAFHFHQQKRFSDKRFIVRVTRDYITFMR